MEYISMARLDFRRHCALLAWQRPNESLGQYRRNLDEGMKT